MSLVLFLTHLSGSGRVSEFDFENRNELALLCVVEVEVRDEVNEELS